MKRCATNCSEGVSSKRQHCNINEEVWLPPEVWCNQILSNLSPKDLALVSTVNNVWSTYQKYISSMLKNNYRKFENFPVNSILLATEGKLTYLPESELSECTIQFCVKFSQLYKISLLNAARYNNIEEVKILSNKMPNMITEALNYAALYGHHTLVEFLLAKVSETQEQNLDYVFWHAIQGNHFEIVKSIYNIAELNEHAKTLALWVAVENGHDKLANWILDTIPGIKNIAINNALPLAVQKGYLSIVKKILAQKSEMTSKKIGEALEFASSNDELSIVEILLNTKPEASVDHKAWALYFAAPNGNTEIAKLLLEKIPGMEDSKDEVLQEFICGNLAGVIRQISNKAIGISANHYDEVFIYAANVGDLSVLSILLDEVSVHCLNDAIRLAAGHGHFHLVKYLLHKVTIDSVGVALVCAARKEHVDVVKLLLEVQEIGIYYKGRALINAMSSCNHELIQVLLKITELPDNAKIKALGELVWDLEAAKLLLEAPQFTHEIKIKALALARRGAQQYRKDIVDAIAKNIENKSKNDDHQYISTEIEANLNLKSQTMTFALNAQKKSISSEEDEDISNVECKTKQTLFRRSM